MPGGGGVPADSPVLLAALAWARRETQRVVGEQTAQAKPLETALPTETVATPVSLAAAKGVGPTAKKAKPPKNAKPVAAADSYTTPVGTPLTVAGPGVLANDSDANLDPLSATLAGKPKNGTVALNADGSFTYTPNASFTGTDTFKYQASDGTAVSKGTKVTITVAGAPNRAPVATNDSATVEQGAATNIPVAANDTDADGAVNPASVVITQQPTFGSATPNVDGTVTYVSDGVHVGPDSFRYTINDNAGAVSNVATVNLTVNPAAHDPIAVDDVASTDEDQPVTIAVLANDSDPDAGDTLRVTGLIEPEGVGTFTNNGDGTITYTPAPNFHGVITFSYVVSDSTDRTDIGSVSVAVIPRDDAPEAVDDSFSTNEDTTLSTGNVLTNDTDLDGDTKHAVLVSGPANAASFQLNDDGTFTYTPKADFNGSDSFTYKVNDDIVDGNTATVAITVTAANDAPVAQGDSFSTAEDITLSTGNVLANDTDADGDTKHAVLVSGPANAASFALNDDGTFTYTPKADFNGSDSFTYKVNDGTVDGNTATVAITVAAANDAPVAQGDSFSTAEDITLSTGNVLANDTDADGDTMHAVLVSGPANAASFALNDDGTFTYTPKADFNGSDSFTYKVNDGISDGNTATATITVSAVNDGPQIASVNQSAPDTANGRITYTVTVTDIDSNLADIGLSVTQPVDGTGTVSQPVRTSPGAFTFTYTPNQQERVDAYSTVAVEQDHFTITATDGRLQTNKPVQVDIDPVAIAVTDTTDIGTAAGFVVVGEDGTIAHTLSTGNGTATNPSHSVVTVTHPDGTTTTSPTIDAMSLGDPQVGADGTAAQLLYTGSGTAADPYNTTVLVVHPDGTTTTITRNGERWVAGGVLVGDNGTVALTTGSGSGTTADPYRTTVTVIHPDGTVTPSQPITGNPSGALVGADGTVAQTSYTGSGTAADPYRTTVTIIRPDGTMTSTPLTAGQPRLARVGDDGTVYQGFQNTSGASIVIIHPDGTTTSTAPISGVFSGGGLQVGEDGTVMAVTTSASGTRVTVFHRDGTTTAVGPFTGDPSYGGSVGAGGTAAQTTFTGTFQNPENTTVTVVYPNGTTTSRTISGAPGGGARVGADGTVAQLSTSGGVITVTVLHPDGTVTSKSVTGTGGSVQIDDDGTVYVATSTGSNFSDTTTVTVIYPDGTTASVPVAGPRWGALRLADDGTLYQVTRPGTYIVSTISVADATATSI
ncbi:beta strand repeat-containing protein [Mycobacterium sp. E740]|uniref:beta strand repeat-containing protein n=1 Tax=Mycobacterium sp. E740 TaxID=1834149 RepID=UPI0035179309